MIAYRTNSHPRASMAPSPAGATEQTGASPTVSPAALPPAGNGSRGGSGSPTAPVPRGDIVYGGTAIARFLFDDDTKTARRRVYNLWVHYRDRGEDTGLFKLKGALCLSQSKWKKFHGL